MPDADARTIRFLDPRAPQSAAVEPYTLTWDRTLGVPAAVGVLVNGFPDSVPFGEALVAALRRRLPDARLPLWNKRNASAPASEAMISEIADTVPVGVTLYGH